MSVIVKTTLTVFGELLEWLELNPSSEMCEKPDLYRLLNAPKLKFGNLVILFVNPKIYLTIFF